MDCEEVKQNLELHVLDALTPDEAAAIVHHLAVCKSCNLAAQEYIRLIGDVRAAHEPVQASTNFEQTVRSSVNGEIERLRSQRRLRRGVIAASVAAAALVLVAVCWRMANPSGRPDRQMAGSTSTDRSTLPEPEVRIRSRQRWRYPGARAAVAASAADGVVVSGKRMYLLRTDGDTARVVALDAETGAAQWQSAVDSVGCIAADRTHVFCLSLAGPRALEMVTLDAGTGQALWRSPRSVTRRLRPPCRPVVVSNGRVCWADGAAVRMMDAETGRTLWVRSFTAGTTVSRPAATAKELLVATIGALYCLDTKTGKTEWRLMLEQSPKGRARPLVDVMSGQVYCLQSINRNQARLFCVDVSTRKVRWRDDLAPARSLLAAKDAVYVRGRQIVALGADEGEQLWTSHAAGCGPLALIDGLLHFVDTTGPGRLIAVRPRTGRKAWEVSGIRSCDVFTRIGPTGYIKTQDGTIHALALVRADSL